MGDDDYDVSYFTIDVIKYRGVKVHNEVSGFDGLAGWGRWPRIRDLRNYEEIVETLVSPLTMQYSITTTTLLLCTLFGKVIMLITSAA